MIKLKKILKEINIQTKKYLVVYPGRFQPFSEHHKKAYNYLKNKFKTDNIYIATAKTYGTEDMKNPLSLVDKIKYITDAGVSKDKILVVSSPYNDKDIFSALPNVNKNNVILIFAVGQKDWDTGRLKVTIKDDLKKNGGLKYIQSYELNKDDLKTADKHAYSFPIPNILTKGGKIASATKVRKKLGLLEGGHVFKDVSDKVDKIKKEDIPNTIDYIIEILGKIFPNMKSIFKTKLEKLGSTMKKDYSGDIDLGLDIEYFVDKKGTPQLKLWSIDEKKYNERYTLLAKRARTATPLQLKVRALIMEIGEIINNKNIPDIFAKAETSLFFLTPQINKLGKKNGKYVQIDIMVGDINWLKFSYYSEASKDPIVKGLHRTQLMLHLFTYKGLIFNHKDGVKDKQTQKILATTPEQAINLLNKLYKFKITNTILSNYETLQSYLKQNLDKKTYNGVIDIYLKTLDSTRTDIPLDLQQYWIDNQDKLGLKGKFLPDTSNLIPYQKEKEK